MPAESSSNLIAVVMGLSILIVDDEENLLVLLERIFKKEGFDVKTATNADQALEILGRGTFRLAILDIKMFPVSGITLLAEIKKRSPQTAVVMVTAYPTGDSREECLKYGAARYLTKPLDIEELKTLAQDLTAG
jgi:DNA-binding NtrC family response regulator